MLTKSQKINRYQSLAHSLFNDTITTAELKLKVKEIQAQGQLSLWESVNDNI
jgi:hypothetical protein